MTMMTWISLGVVCFLMLVAIGAMLSVRFRVLRHVSGRARLTGSEFSEKFFPPEQKEIAARVLCLLAPYLPVAADRVYPGDRLIDDLGLSVRFSRGLDEVEFVHDLEDEFNIEFGEDDYLRLQTFRDAVEIVAEKT